MPRTSRVQSLLSPAAYSLGNQSWSPAEERRTSIHATWPANRNRHPSHVRQCQPSGNSQQETHTFICKFLVNIIERNACAHGDNPCGGIDTDIFQTSKVDHDVL